MRVKPVLGKVILMLCIAIFLAGSLFTSRTSIHSSEKLMSTVTHDYDHIRKLAEGSSGGDIMGEVTKTHDTIQLLDKAMSTLEMELEAAQTGKSGGHISSQRVPSSSSNHDSNSSSSSLQKKAFVVIGINTAFSSKKRRDSLRETWMPRGMLVSTLERYQSKPRIYIGCMKSGPVLFQKELKYHEPEFWKFGEEGNKYFRHATGQIYAISNDLATYISINSAILHTYANEDVSLGSWLIGLEVEHVDDRSMCCGTPPDCAWQKQTGNVCVASFDWSCSGICKSVERMKTVHNKCGEGDGAVWEVDH